MGVPTVGELAQALWREVDAWLEARDGSGRPLVDREPDGWVLVVTCSRKHHELVIDAVDVSRLFFMIEFRPPPEDGRLEWHVVPDWKDERNDLR